MAKRLRRKRHPYVEDRSQLRMTSFQPKKISYPQNWKAYDKAQLSEQGNFMALLADICGNVVQSKYEFGRPKLPLSDMIIAAALKVYTTYSLRRYMSSMRRAVNEGYVDTFCSYSSISNYMRKLEITRILYQLIEQSSIPLKSVETEFGVDSTGFSTSRYGRYFSYKHGKDVSHKMWVKAHVACGLKTNVVTAISLSDETGNDSPYLKPLIETTAKTFDIREAVADKAYSSRENIQFVERLGGAVFIPFKKRARALSMGSPAWTKMWHYFMYNREDFLKHYHKRSNCETVFHMIKAKFGGSVRSKDKTAQYNEVLLKVLCHNICVLIQEMHELGLTPDFTATNLT